MKGLMMALPLLAVVSAGAQQATPAPLRDASDVLTVAGCVQRETDYRAAVKEGKGGIAGTGIGESHNFVLRSVRTVSSDTFKPTGKREPYEVVYRLGGKLEGELGNAVGHQVAVSGYVKVEDSKGTNKVEDLPDMVVIGWHNIDDHCTSQKK